MQFTFRKQVNENSRQGTFAICHQRLKSPVRNHFGTANFIPNEMTGNFCTVCHLSFENQLSRPVLAVFNICWKDQGTKHYTRHNFLKKKQKQKKTGILFFKTDHHSVPHVVMVFSSPLSRVSAKEAWYSGDQTQRQRRTVCIF